MPSFFDRISNKFQAPAEKGSAGGGSSTSPEGEKGQYDNLRPDQIWISGGRRIKITCIDPPSRYEYGLNPVDAAKEATKLYGDIAELKKELEDGGFTLEPPREKKKKSKNESSSEGQGVDAQTQDSGTEEAVPVEPASPDVEVQSAVSSVAPGTGDTIPEDSKIEGTPDILEQLAPEGAELRKMMDGYMEDIKLRGSLGWISSLEESKLRRMWKESDEILEKTFASFQEKGWDIEKARKELESVRVNLSIVYTNDDNEAGLKFFLEHKHKHQVDKEERVITGSQEAEMIEKMFRDAREVYFHSFPKGKVPKEANKYWKKYVLPELEEETLAYMNAITQERNEKKKTRMNRGAIQLILTNIAIADSESHRKI